MDERGISVNIMKETKTALRGSVVIKHADRATSDIPDISVSWYGATSWVEVKYLRTRDKLKDIVAQGQMILGHQLATVCAGRAWIVVYEVSPKRVTVWNPGALFRYLNPSLDAAVDFPGWKRPGTEPLELRSGYKSINLFSILKSHGAFYVTGWDYGIVAQLIRQSFAS